MTLTINPAPRFSGTGADGKPKVLIAKAEYCGEFIKGLQASDQIENLGWVMRGDVFAQQLRHTQPDVVVIGTNFGAVAGMRPIEALQHYVAETGRKVGIVISSSFRNQTLDLPAGTFESVHEGSANLTQCQLDAIKRQDPFPVTA